ncbi:subtilisin-like protein [Polychaeton citri CBS 116435]|uniref:Subtilisin-like protein n=1 Tax=Polychaeton citri CBS 116435 TaxID=1314669 RepID=A0A9P4Q2K0_9PEZI|nr:subtilisin-like protein [Polychaeton citri CBS 116435]
MRSFLSILAALPAIFAAPVLNLESNAQSIAGQWIIQTTSGTDESAFNAIVTQLTTLLGIQPKHTYNFGNYRGISVSASDALIQTITNLANIKSIERDSTVYANALVTQSGAPYGLGRISHRAPGSTQYIYDSSAGSGTYSYIIDTGIYTSHNDFGGRATFGANFAGDGLNTDGNGHGTHVAGTTGSTTYGVAKKTNLIAVKVLDSQGSGATSNVIAGIQWAYKDAKAKSRIGKAVGNLSLGGSFSQSTNDAVTEAVKQGLFLAVAAGNSGVDAKSSSPASAPNVCTVGASDSTDRRASFSNYGPVVDIFAPGVNILSTWIDDPNDTNTISGTSMASPHVAGLGAYLLALEGARDPIALCDRIKTLSTKNIITNPGASTTSNLAYNGNGA